MIKLFTKVFTKNDSVYEYTELDSNESTPNLMNDADFLEYLEEDSVPEEEKQIAFAEWLKENEDK
jgi:hypothetical protein